jgi:ABC-type Fe3+ transport system permease subunit
LRRLLTLLCLLLAFPVLGVLAAWFALDADALDTLAHQFATVLPGYALQSALLTLGVALGVMLLGTATAAAVTLFDFPGRRAFEWALLLPLAMPAYVLAYAWTDALQFSGPLQTSLRELTGARGALWPDVRSLGGAVVLFVLVLYPYVYLLTRTALGERAANLLEAARLLGAGLRRRVMAVALPLARPAITAGVALAVMETLADYGVGAYFGLATFSTGIFKAWLVMDDRIAAAQLASVLLLVVGALLWWSAGRSAACASPPRAAAAAGLRKRCRCACAVPLPSPPGRCALCRCCWGSCCPWAGCCGCWCRRFATPSSACRWRALRAGPGPVSGSRPWRRCWPPRWPSRSGSRCGLPAGAGAGSRLRPGCCRWVMPCRAPWWRWACWRRWG